MKSPMLYPLLDIVWESKQEFLVKIKLEDNNISFSHILKSDHSLFDLVKKDMIVFASIKIAKDIKAIGVHCSVEEVARKSDQKSEQKLLQLKCLPEEKNKQKLILDFLNDNDVIEFVTRRNQRCRCKLPVRVTTPDDQQYTTWALNISQSGIFISFPYNIGPGVILNLQIEFPQLEMPFAIKGKVRGVVVNGMYPGIGIEMVDMTESCKDILSRQLDNLPIID